MELKDYLRVTNRRKWWIIATILAVTSIALIYSLLFQDKVYEATSRIIVREKPLGSDIFSTLDLEDMSTQPERSIQTQVELIRSKNLAAQVIEALQLQLSPNELMKKLKVEPLSKTNIIEIKIKDRRPELARDIANQYVIKYQEWRRSENVKEVAAARTEVWDALQKTKDEAIALSREIEQRFGSQPVPEELKVEQQIAFNYYVDLQRTYRELVINEELMSGGLEILTDEDAPSKPVEPQPVRAGLLALLVGSVLGFALAFLVNYLDDTVEGREEAERLFDAPVLGEIPRSPEIRADSRSNIVMISSPRSATSEAFRALRTNIQYINYELKSKVILITSSGPGEGKTFVTANLGVALAEAGHKVLIVCADMRKPGLHGCFHLHNKAGLSTVLIGKGEMEDFLASPGFPNLKVLTSGPLPPNPSELLGSRRMKEALEKARSRFDFVLMDTPPVLATSDTAVLGPRVDGVIIVINAGSSRRDEAKKSRELLSQVKTRILGTVLNNVTHAHAYGYYYYYHYSQQRGK